MRRVLRRPRAILDLIELAEHIGKADPDTADRFVTAADTSIAEIAQSPGLGSIWESAAPTRHELRWRPVAGFPRHLIFYFSSDDAIEVVRVLHSSRDLDRILNPGRG